MTDKLKLIERLIKDGAIDLSEALILLETEKETVYVPTVNYPKDWSNLDGNTTIYFDGKSTGGIMNGVPFTYTVN